MTATLDLVIGGMFSGKTSELIRRLKRFKAIDQSVLVVNSARDTRNEAEVLATHDGVVFDCVKTEFLVDVPLTAQVIAIDEVCFVNTPTVRRFVTDSHKQAQFFTGLRAFVERALAAGKHVIVAGLDGDYRQQKFGEILDLVPLADRVVKLTALCMICSDGTAGPFSKRTTTDTCQRLIGGKSEYMAVCRRHLFCV